VSLAPTEFRLLNALAGRSSCAEPLRAAWPPGAEVSDDSLHQYIALVPGKLRGVTAGTAIVTTPGLE
jgi:hypothetical protein